MNTRPLDETVVSAALALVMALHGGVLAQDAANAAASPDDQPVATKAEKADRAVIDELSAALGNAAASDTKARTNPVSEKLDAVIATLDEPGTVDTPAVTSEELAQKERTISDLLARVAAAEKDVASLQKQLQEARAKDDTAGRKKLESKLKAAEKQAEKAGKALKELRKASDQKIAGLGKDLAKATASVEKLQTELDRARKLAAATGSAEPLSADVAELQTQLQEMQATDAQRRETLDDLFKQLAEVKRSRAGLQAEYDGLQAELQGKVAELEAAADQKRSMVDKRSDLETAVAKAKDRMQEAIDKAADLDTLNREASSNLRAARKRHEELLAEIDRLKMTDQQRKIAMDELLTKVALAERQRAEAETKQTADQDELAAMQQQLDAAAVKVQEAEQKVQAASDERAAMEATLANSQQRIQDAQDRVDQADARTAEVKAQLQAARTRHQELLAQIERLNMTDQQRKLAMDELLAKIAQTERKAAATNKEHQEKVAALEAQLANVRSAEQVATARIGELESAIDAAGKQSGAATDQVRQVQEQLEQMSAERDNALAKSAEAASQVAQMQASLERVKATDEQRRRTMDDLLTKIADMETTHSNQVKMVESNRDQLRQELTQKLGELEAARSAKASLEARTEQLTKSLGDVTTERDSLISEAGRRDGDVKRLTGQVDSLEAEVTRMRSIDEQRKRNMDKVLMEQATSEQKARELNQEITRLQGRVADLQKSGGGGAPAAGTGDEQLHAQFAALQEERAQLSRKVRELQAQIEAGGGSPVATPVPSSGDADQWEAARLALETRVMQLEKQLQETEGRLEASSTSEGELQKRVKALQDKAGNVDTMAVAERKRLEEEYAGKTAQLNESVQSLEAERGRMMREIETLKNRKFDVRESDLFKQLEKANVALRSKVVELERLRETQETKITSLNGTLDKTQRDLEGADRRMRAAQTQLSDVEAREKEYKQLIEKMMVRVPDLEAAVAELEQQVAERERDITERDSRITSLETALEEREFRLRKAERVADVLETATRDVQHSNDVEKRDMHFNMALVYAREGRTSEAEKEYLSALELDPTDPDIHFNLAILYEEQLKQTEKAAVHYRRYLKLKPHGEDADAVRNWLMRLEMDK